MVGDLAQAEASLDQVISARPGHSAAYLTRADLRRQTPQHNHIAAIENQLARAVDDKVDAIPLWYALGKELEDVGRHAEAFSAWTHGAALHRRRSPYDVQDDVRTLARIEECHTASSLRAGASGHLTQAPIFVLGLPRSGTTLVESILGVHPEVGTPGELPAFPNSCIAALTALGIGQVPKQEFANRVLQIPARDLGERYLAAVRSQTAQKPRFVDKLPLNYLYAGIIHRAMPEARIVLLERDPRDSCLAMYKTLFTAAYPFSYDLADLAAYFTAWRKLMAHWRTVLGEALLTVRYEDLVTRTGEVVSDLLTHCRLDHHPDCLSYAGRKGQVSTASATQVRQPIYASSIGRWRAYERELAPLIDHLRAMGALSD
jgi:tetratricopeptide (TPR) repeat protein